MCINLCIFALIHVGIYDSFVILGGVALDNPFSNPAPEWLSQKSWSEIIRASQLSTGAFQGLRESFEANIELFKKFYDCASPQTEPFPSPWEEKLTDLQKLILLRCLRPVRRFV